MDSPLNVSPTYGVYDKKTSQEAINERREARRQLSTDPATRTQAGIDAISRVQEALEQRVAALEGFRAGMNGDENIKVADNKITWVGRVSAENLEATEFDVCVDGDPMVTNIPNDGFRALA